MECFGPHPPPIVSTTSRFETQPNPETISLRFLLKVCARFIASTEIRYTLACMFNFFVCIVVFALYNTGFIFTFEFKREM